MVFGIFFVILILTLNYTNDSKFNLINETLINRLINKNMSETVADEWE